MDTNISWVYRSFQSIYRSKLFYIAFSGLILATNSWASIPYVGENSGDRPGLQAA
ncbi:MAG: hypothetical protein GY820_48725 [Gammaproteobacteria bacterium]|nr:hypothetical protein [Gammaproteobacteria bacterium]